MFHKNRLYIEVRRRAVVHRELGLLSIITIQANYSTEFHGCV